MSEKDTEAEEHNVPEVKEFLRVYFVDLSDL